MAADDRTINHVLPVVGQSEVDQRSVPHTLLGLTPEPDIDRVPLAIALMHVAPGTADPQHLEHTVQEPPVVMRWTGFAAALGRQQHPDDSPFLARHVASTQHRLQKAALNQRLRRLGFHYAVTA